MVNRSRLACVVALGLMLAATVTSVAKAAGPGGHWTGAIQTPGQPLQVEIDLAAQGAGGWIGTITIPAQHLTAFPLSSIEVQGNTVSFAMKGVPGDPLFRGTLAADGATLAGDFTQGPGRFPFQLKRTGNAVIAETPKSTAVSKELEGDWDGSLNAGGNVLRLRLKLKNTPAGATGSIVSLDQNGVEIPIAAVTQTGSRLQLQLPSINGSFSGELKDGRLVGDWTQMGGTLPLTFTRAKP